MTQPVKNACWVLIGLAALAFVAGSYLAFSGSMYIIPPAGYWRGAIGFLLFAITLRLMDMKD
jgi:hypothetical protein